MLFDSERQRKDRSIDPDGRSGTNTAIINSGINEESSIISNISMNGGSRRSRRKERGERNGDRGESIERGERGNTRYVLYVMLE